MRVAVLGGGRSSEHDVSIQSAVAIGVGLEQAGHEVTAITVGRDGHWTTRSLGVSVIPAEGLRVVGEALEVDVVFPALHGPYGEDGTVQGLLECAGLPYVGSGVQASALCMDKVEFKELMSRTGIEQVGFAGVRAGDSLEAAEALGLPVFVKPARLGSSVGISKVTAPEELRPAIDRALEHDPLAIVEAAAFGLEVEVGVIGNSDVEASRPGELVVHGDWYDYESKYTDGGMELVVPARIPDELAEHVRGVAIGAYRHAGCEGMGRVDFFIEDPQGPAPRVLVNEINTIPGFTELSVFSKLWEASGLPYPNLLDRLLELALERHSRRASYLF